MNAITEMLDIRVGQVVSDTFTLIFEAEQAIEDELRDCHDHLKPLVFGAFQSLRPHMMMPELLFRQHAKQILRRVQYGQDIHVPTDAEVVNVFSEMSFRAPLSPDWAAAYHRAFITTMPTVAFKHGIHQFRAPSYEGADLEILAETARWLGRRFPKRAEPEGQLPGGQRLERMESEGITIPKEGQVNTLYTIGYAGLFRDDLLHFIRQQKAFLVDTRLVPRSRDAQWDRVALTNAFSPDYVHVQDLGNVNYRNGGPIQLKDQAKGLHRLLELLAERPCMLLCMCKDVATCHRGYIARVSGWPDIVHLKPSDISANLPLL